MALLVLAACGARDPASAEIVAARLRATPAPVLEADLKLTFSAPMLEALERGIPLTLEFVLEGETATARLVARRHLELRFLPLARQYQILDRESGAVRRVARRTQLFVALDRVHLALTPEWAALATAPAELTLQLALEDESLPGPLRLPALVSPSWRLVAAEHSWPSPG